MIDELAAAPARIAAAAARVDESRLHASPSPGEWSAAEVLAHLRACGDVWGAVVRRIVAEDEPTIRAISPRALPLDAPFGESLAAFTADRTVLVSLLRSLTEEQWERGATITGAGAPLRKTVRSYVERLARHERSHLRQLERALGD